MVCYQVHKNIDNFLAETHFQNLKQTKTDIFFLICNEIEKMTIKIHTLRMFDVFLIKLKSKKYT